MTDLLEGTLNKQKQLQKVDNSSLASKLSQILQFGQKLKPIIAQKSQNLAKFCCTVPISRSIDLLTSLKRLLNIVQTLQIELFRSLSIFNAPNRKFLDILLRRQKKFGNKFGQKFYCFLTIEFGQHYFVRKMTTNLRAKFEFRLR